MTKDRMKASDLLVNCLELEGVEYVFGVPGEENADFVMSLKHSDRIHFVLTRHEQGAAFMAEAYGRLTGSPAVCLGTLGPGATNLITGQYEIYPVGMFQRHDEVGVFFAGYAQQTSAARA